MSEPASPPPSGGSRDPRLEIPEVLRTPVPRPESMAKGERVGGDVGKSYSGAQEAAKGWAIAMNFVFGVIAGALLGWGVQWIWPATAPWALIIGLGAGLIGGFVRFIKEGLQANR